MKSTLKKLQRFAEKAMVWHAGAPVSAFQMAIRGDCTVLHDHICKEMNELNLERCRCIPKNTPGADWRVLQEIVAANPDRATFKVWSAIRCQHLCDARMQGLTTRCGS